MARRGGVAGPADSLLAPFLIIALLAVFIIGGALSIPLSSNPATAQAVQPLQKDAGDFVADNGAMIGFFALILLGWFWIGSSLPGGGRRR